MKLTISSYRLSILVGLAVLIALLSVMSANLISQLRVLSSAQHDNPQWSISQLETEFANLEATLSQQLVDTPLPSEQIRLRMDIALSRLEVINSGQAAEMLNTVGTADRHLAQIMSYATSAIKIIDKPGRLNDADIRKLLNLTKSVRPAVRRAVVIGVGLGAERTQMRRDQFTRQLAQTGGIAIALLVAMAALMLFLDRLLRRAAENDVKLTASSQRLASTISASLDAIVTADAQGRIIEFNEAAEEIFGWQRDEILGEIFDEIIIPPALRNQDMSMMERFIASGNQSLINGGRLEMVALRKSGEQFPVELNIQTITHNEQTAFVAYLRDISARIISEQKLIDARDRAERTDKAKSHFLTVMSHEMRTPLNGILGVIDLLKGTGLSAEQTRYAQIAAASGQLLLEHINEALDITRIETGTLQLTDQDFELEPMVTGLIGILEPLAAEKGLRLACDVEPAAKLSYRGDATRLRQILTNLIGNAIKFTASGEIKLQLSAVHGVDSSSLRFAVSDTGTGIAADHYDQIFEDFDALAQGPGRQIRKDGLGLSISRKLARQMGGDLTVESKKGGTTFTLAVSLKRADASGIPTANPENAQDVSAIDKRHILMVEDNRINRKVLGDMLTKLGYQTGEAVDGIEGVKCASTRKFDLIFMDISMPKMDGIEATKRIRTDDGPNAATCIIGLTAHGRDEYRTRALDAGMNLFQTKPIRLNALADILNEI